MDREELIQVHFQIPPSALDSLSRLAEQLRLLTETAHTQAAPAGSLAETRHTETGHTENGSFDLERFRALLERADRPESAAAALSAPGDARTVFADFSPAGAAETASGIVEAVPRDAASVPGEARAVLQEAAGAGELFSLDRPAPVPAQDLPGGHRPVPAEDPESRLPRTEAPRRFAPEEIPAFRAEMGAIAPDAPEERRESRLPPDPAGLRAAVERELELSSAPVDVSSWVETAPEAAAVQTPPEAPQSRWNRAAEELVLPDPAPLPAEAVSLAFERDSRRYDNGFPLY